MKALSHIFSNGILLAASSIGVLAKEFTTKYIFSDVEYLKWLVIAVTLDLVTGIAKVWAKEGYKAVTSKGIRMTIAKFIQYGAFLIITHVLVNVTVGESKPFAFVKDWAYLLLLLVEIKSVYENITAIDNRLDFINPIIQKIGEMIKSKQDENK